MSDWPSLFHAPENPADINGWFSRIAGRLLNGCSLLVGQQPHRVVEIELYYWSKAHPDPFAHRDPIQFEIGHWYFHRAHGVFRGGSFKGLDLTFGNADASGGVLIRGLEKPDGTFIDGPSLCVDYLLKATGTKTVATLDHSANKSLAWEKGNPLRLHEVQGTENRAPMRTPRVGLSLKRAASSPESTRFLMLPYRYLTEPRRTKKGKIVMVLALHVQGVCLARIQQLTNCPRRAIERYVADFERGQNEADFAPYFGAHLGPSELCKLYGVWFAHWGFHGEMR
jgi:3-methyladenine DNA glycosylase Mpg